MAINAGAIARTLGSWLANNHPVEAKSHESKVASRTLETASAGSLSIGWGALDDAEEEQRLRKAGQELIKYQSISRGY
jgi:hypothetical protein